MMLEFFSYGCCRCYFLLDVLHRIWIHVWMCSLVFWRSLPSLSSFHSFCILSLYLLSSSSKSSFFPCDLFLISYPLHLYHHLSFIYYCSHSLRVKELHDSPTVYLLNVYFFFFIFPDIFLMFILLVLELISIS